MCSSPSVQRTSHRRAYSRRYRCGTRRSPRYGCRHARYIRPWLFACTRVCPARCRGGVPGPTGFVPALVEAALLGERFCFEGFLPHRKGRQQRLDALKDEHRTIVLYESPYRISKTLSQLAESLGAERRAAVCREISKKFSETLRGTLAELIEHFSTCTPKGEFVVVVEGMP